MLTGCGDWSVGVLGAFIPGQQAALISEPREAAAALRPGRRRGIGLPAWQSSEDGTPR